MIILGIGIFTIFGNFIQKFTTSKIGQNVAFKLRADLFKNVIHKNTEFFNDQRNNPGILNYRLSTDCEHAQKLISESTGAIFQRIGSFVGGIVLVLISDWRFGLIGLTTSPWVLA